MSVENDPVTTATFSVISCLVSELNKSKSLDFGDLIESIQGTAVDHRNKGHEKTAAVMYEISNYLLKTVRD